MDVATAEPFDDKHLTTLGLGHSHQPGPFSIKLEVQNKYLGIHFNYHSPFLHRHWMLVVTFYLLGGNPFGLKKLVWVLGNSERMIPITWSKII